MRLLPWLLWSLAGFAGGFVAAGLLTEPFEESLRHEATTMKAALLFLGAWGLLAWSRREAARGASRRAAVLSATAASTPAFYALYEVDHYEAMLGLGAALTLAWAAVATPASARERAKWSLVCGFVVLLSLGWAPDFPWPLRAFIVASLLLYAGTWIAEHRLRRTTIVPPVMALLTLVVTIGFAIWDFLKWGVPGDAGALAIGAAFLIAVVLLMFRRLGGGATTAPMHAPVPVRG